MRKLCFAAIAAVAVWPIPAQAQLSTNPDKFLGNITTYGSVDTNDIEFWTLWNQITPENESKWASIEGSRNNMNWLGCDRCYNYAKEHNFPFKFHTLAWGSQYPSWMDNLSESQQYTEFIQWLDAVQARYPDLDMIDVVNEAIPGHAPAPFRNALGGEGVTGYDWIINCFKLAHERWPEAILIYNDYNTFQWNTNEFINLVKIIRDAGAPIDAYGCQSHDLTDCSLSTFKQSMTRIQNALRMPMYSSEYDIGTDDNDKQLRQYRDQITYMWESPYVAGITLWGYIYGRTWTTNGNSGIIRDGQDRPAMSWLRQYMATPQARTAVSPFPNFKKEASLYIRPETPMASLNVPFNIYVDATLRTKTIDRVELYVDDRLAYTLTEAPFVAEYLPETLGRVELHAILYDTEGNTYERFGGFRVIPERKPFHGEPIQLPGMFQAEDFDICTDGVSYHDSDSKNEGVMSYRSDAEGVDISRGGTGYVIGYTNKGEWLEYTVEFTESGRFDIEICYAAGGDGASVSISLIENNNPSVIADIDLPGTGNWATYTTSEGVLLGKRFARSTYTMRLTITGGYANIDYINIYKHGTGGISDVESVTGGDYQVYTTTGMYLGDISIESHASLRPAIEALTCERGVFVIRDKATGESQLISL